jgi:class 3 adenylate cyclase
VAREQRKLAAILTADVVGYSRLMGRDESGTLATRWSEPFDSTADRRGAWKTYEMASGLDAMVIAAGLASGDMDRPGATATAANLRRP